MHVRILQNLSLFDCVTETKDFFQEVSVEPKFPMECNTNDSLGKIIIGFNLTNQATNIKKFPKYSNPPNNLCKSFESKESFYGTSK